MHEHLVEIIAVAWFLFCWIGYSYFAKSRSNRVPSLSSITDAHREEWAMQTVGRENRMSDVASCSMLEHSASFFASCTLLIIAAIAAALGATDKAVNLLTSFSFNNQISILEWELILIGMITMFVYAFFKISWSVRLYGFVVAMIGALPPSNLELSISERKKLSTSIAKTLSTAAYHFNGGLRAYYFSLAVFGWLVSPWLFMLLTALVVNELHRREFRSQVLKNILSIESWKGSQEND